MSLARTSRFGSSEKQRGERTIERLIENLDNLRMDVIKREYISLSAALNLRGDTSLSLAEPARTDIVVKYDFSRLSIFYSPQGIEVRGVRVDKYGTPYLITGKAFVETNITDLLALLFYSGGYESLRRGEYSGDSDVADLLLDIGEMVYQSNVSEAMRANLREKDYNVDKVIYMIRWDVADWTSIKYVGLSVSRAFYTPQLVFSDERMDVGNSEHPPVSLDGRNPLYGLSMNRANSLPVVVALIGSFDRMRERYARYNEDVVRAHVAVKAYASYGDES